MTGNAPILQAVGIGMRFGSLAALQGLDFEVDEGEILAVIGPNGAGKSTLINVVSGTLPILSGDVRFRGRSLRGLGPHRIARSGIARTFQIAQPFAGMTVIENVMVGAMFGGARRTGAVRAARRHAADILTLVGLEGLEAAPGDRLDVPAMKRLELARALATGPQLLLLDEIMAGLSPTEVGDMIGLIRKIRDTGTTILLVEHVMTAVLRLCDRILVLHHGEKIADGPPGAVLKHETVIRAYLGERYRA